MKTEEQVIIDNNEIVSMTRGLRIALDNLRLIDEQEFAIMLKDVFGYLQEHYKNELLKP